MDGKGPVGGWDLGEGVPCGGDVGVKGQRWGEAWRLENDEKLRVAGWLAGGRRLRLRGHESPRRWGELRWVWASRPGPRALGESQGAL